MLIVFLTLFFAIASCLFMSIFISIVKFVFNWIIIPSFKLTSIVCFSLFLCYIAGKTGQNLVSFL